MNWLRLWSEARNDRKLATLTDAEFRVWFNLLCMAGESRQRGTVLYDDLGLLALEVSGGDADLLSATLAKCARLRIVTDDGAAVVFVNWGKRQYDKPSDSPEATRERKQRQRDRARQGVNPDGVTPMSRPVTPHIQNRAETEQTNEPQAAPVTALPTNGTAQAIVAAYCDAAGIQRPAVYKKAVGQAALLAKAGVTAEDIPDLYRYVSGWADGADLGTLLSQVDKWRASKTRPAPGSRELTDDEIARLPVNHHLRIQRQGLRVV